MPEITVIVPVYNVDSYLCQCIESILAQTFTDFELILVNDGSTDYSCVFSDKYALLDDRICVIHQQNAGVSAARNIGLLFAKGKYVVFCDSDDYVGKKYIENLYIPKYDLVISNYYEDKSAKQEGIIPIKRRKFSAEAIKKNSKEQFNAIISMHSINSCCSKLFRTDIINANSIHFDKNCSFGEDTIFSAHYFSFCNSFCITDKLDYFYRIHEKDSLSTTLNIQYLSDYKKSVISKYKYLNQLFVFADDVALQEYLECKFSYYFFRIFSDDTHCFSEKKSIFKWLLSENNLLNALERKKYDFESIGALMTFIINLKSSFVISFMSRVHSISKLIKH